MLTKQGRGEALDSREPRCQGGGNRGQARTGLVKRGAGDRDRQVAGREAGRKEEGGKRKVKRKVKRKRKRKSFARQDRNRGGAHLGAEGRVVNGTGEDWPPWQPELFLLRGGR